MKKPFLIPFLILAAIIIIVSWAMIRKKNQQETTNQGQGVEELKLPPGLLINK